MNFDIYISRIYNFKKTDNGLSSKDRLCITELCDDLSKTEFKNKLDYIEEIKKYSSNFSNYVFTRIEFANQQRKLLTFLKKIKIENSKVFIVHGRNVSMKNEVEILLGKLKINYVILSEESNSGNTVIEKFINESKDCFYSIVLYSNDDLGKYKGDSELASRARENVVFEMGYFIGRLGRSNTMILKEAENNFEFPSDFKGLVYNEFSSDGTWKNRLIKELIRAGVIDQNSYGKI